MRWLWLGIAGLVAACTSSLPNYEARTHVVQRGETLYSIAFRYNVDHTALARWNSLDDPDVINVGQRLRLRPPGEWSGQEQRTASASSSASPERRASSSAEPASRAPSRSAESSPAPRTAAVPRWRWPTDGRVVTSFGSTTAIASGVGIAGRMGQRVDAAAAGRVVYAGTGLIGYGQLIIIKHDETYLSAYGYNDRVLVSQGDAVERGEKIAEMGLGPQREPRLHFEIRRNGTPVDPLQFVAGPE